MTDNKQDDKQDDIPKEDIKIALDLHIQAIKKVASSVKDVQKGFEDYNRELQSLLTGDKSNT